MAKLKYIAGYFIPLLALLCFHSTGWRAWLGIVVIFVFIPLLEMFIPPNTYNLDETERELAKEDVYFDLVLYLLVPLHLFVIYTFLTTIDQPGLTASDLAARILMMGVILGFLGINIGHELGHKTQHTFKSFLAQVLLTTSLQNHFVPYHNGGHHKDVATPNDLTSARKGDNYYWFALRSQIGGYFKTWRLEARRRRAQGKSDWWNPMILYTLLPFSFLAMVFVFFGPYVFLCYFAAAIFGISLLESQNYFAHYGLRRQQRPDGTYERVGLRHSWNSDHLIGRIILFELTRHSDHHHSGSKPYQILESKAESPMLPYGYPVMLILSYLPFIFRPVMNRQLVKYGEEGL